ncbi:MAG: hypothetical protein ACYSOK_02285 [Planctomycetota bacterium]|jgi:hypothetical protein
MQKKFPTDNEIEKCKDKLSPIYLDKNSLTVNMFISIGSEHSKIPIKHDILSIWCFAFKPIKHTFADISHLHDFKAYFSPYGTDVFFRKIRQIAISDIQFSMKLLLRQRSNCKLRGYPAVAKYSP